MLLVHVECMGAEPLRQAVVIVNKSGVYKDQLEESVTAAQDYQG